MSSKNPTRINRLALIALFSLILSVSIVAQQYSGKVIDANTKKPVPFANIAFGDGKTGTITDLNGKYSALLSEIKTPITFSCIGYQKKTTDIVSLLESTIIELNPLTVELGNIDIYPGVNTALTIMNKVVENREIHNPNLSTNYSCIIYHKLNFKFEIPDSLYLSRNLELTRMKRFSNVADLLLIESVSEKKHLKPNKTNERLISGRVSGFKDPALSYLPAQLQPFTFYDKYIRLLDTEYLNPVSTPGLKHYSFLLTDTIIDTKGDTIFYIKFKPLKQKKFNGLTGALHIHQPDWAIKTVSTKSLSQDKSNSLVIRQNYQLINDSIWFPFQMESKLVIKKSNTKGKSYPIIASGKSYVTAINLNPKITAKDFNNITFEDALNSKNSPPIETFRHEPLSHKDSVTYHLIDSIGRKMHIDKLITLQKSAIQGNIPWGIIDIDYRKLLDYNDYEGFKLGLGLWTNKRLSQYFSLGGYYTYGFKSKKSNYGTGVNITPWKKPETKFSFLYENGMNATGTFNFLDAYNMRSPESFQRFMFETMDYTKEYSADVQFRLLKYFKTQIGFKDASITPIKQYRYLTATDTVAPFNTQEFGIKLKWAYKETFSDTPFGRISNGTKWPTVWVNFTYGLGNNTTNFIYQRYEMQIHQDIKINPSNTTSIRIKAGLIDGDVSATLLYSTFGSYKTVGMEIPYSMATMRLNEFAANKFAIVNLNHKLSLLLNKPGKFKPVINLTTNIGISNTPVGAYSFNKGYYESGIFFNNLFRQLITKYGLGIHYRYGPYRLNRGIDNWAFNIGIEFIL